MAPVRNEILDRLLRVSDDLRDEAKARLEVDEAPGNPALSSWGALELSPAASPKPGDDWKVVAIHHAGGELVANARGDKMFANQGILMSFICARFPVLTAQR
jgi:hypothetical protein